jgi:hypothetical protein
VPLRGVWVCALMVLVAGNAMASESSMHARSRGWIRWSDAAQERAVRERAARARGSREPGSSPFAAAPGTGALGSIAWTGGGYPVCATVSGQFGVDAVSDGASGVIAGWVDYRDTQFDVYAMRLDGNGNRLWTAGGVLAAPSTVFIDHVLAMSDGSSGAFLIFGLSNVNGYSDILVQHLTSTGAIASGWAATGRSTVPGGATGFGAVPTNDGFLFMGWEDMAGQLRVLRLAGDGSVASGWNAAGLALGRPQNDGNITPASDGAGGGYICWAETDSVLLARVTAGGAVASGFTAAGNVINSGTSSIPGLGLTVAPLTGGDAMVFWVDFRTFDFDIYAQRITSAGGTGAGWPATGLLALGGADYQLYPDAVSDDAGGAVVVCQMDATAGSPDSLLAQRLTGTGALASGWTASGVTLARHSGKTAAIPISDGAGGVVVAWTAVKAADDDVFASRVAGTGAIAAGWPASGQTVCAESADQNEVVIVPDGANGAIAVWEDYRDVAERVFAARVQSDGTVPALASLVSASAEPGLARLQWWSADGAQFTAGVERATGDGAFAEIARVNADGQGLVRFEDRDVVAGVTYRYRLAVSDAGAIRYLGEVTLRVPEGSRLALAGFVPNPAVGTPRLAYTLPNAQPARIEVLDTAGRRVFERDVDSSPGEHVVSFDRQALGPGVYTLRITQGARSVTTRATIVR